MYSSTDPVYRAASLEAVFATYMETTPAFEEFMQEVEERWVYGMVLFSELFIFSGVLFNVDIVNIVFIVVFLQAPSSS